MKALRIAASGMMAQQHYTEVVANNLANMNTTGYQRRRTEFSDLIYDVAERKPSRSSRAGKIVPGVVESGHGVRMTSIYRVSEQGSLRAVDEHGNLYIEETARARSVRSRRWLRQGCARRWAAPTRKSRTPPRSH